MRKKLLSILALLCLTVSGAWADETYTIKFEANEKSVTKNVTLPHTFSCDYVNKNGELDQIIQSLYESYSGGQCSPEQPAVPYDPYNDNVTGGYENNNQSITISGPFEGTVTVTSGYMVGKVYNQYTLTISFPDYIAPPVASGYCGDPTVNEGKNVSWELTGHPSEDFGREYTLTISGTGAMADYTSGEFNNINPELPPAPAPWCRDEFEFPYYPITSIEIGNGVTHIGDYAFWNLSAFSSIEIPINVESIGNGAFEQCMGLQHVTLNEGLKSIGGGAFGGSYLLAINIPASVTSVGALFVNDCIHLESITVASGNQVYITDDGHSMLIDNTTHTLMATCASRTEITIPNTVTSIGDNAFCNWQGTSITIPAGVTSIGMGAFLFCTDLESIEIPAKVTSIGGGAFYNCSNLQTIILNSNPYIGEEAFLKQQYNYNPETHQETVTVSYPNSVTMNLTANADETGAYKWMTFNNENYSFTPDANTTAYKGVLNGSNVQLVPVADVLADNAVILKSTSSDVTLTLTTSPTTTSDDFTGNALTSVKWTAENWNTPANCYTLSRGKSGEGTLGFYKYSGSTLNYGKAYLITPNAAPSFIGFNEGGATAIEVPAATNNVENGGIYDLTGRRIESQPAKKGIYVKNGKKFIVK